MRERAHGGIRRHAIAHFQGFGVGHEFFDEAIIQFFLHQEARGADADLAGIAELGKSKRLGRQIKIGIVEDNGRRMAAQFHRHALHVLARQCGKLLADGGGAREGDFANDRMRDQIGRNFCRHAIDQIGHTRRQPGINEGADQFRR